MRIAFGHESWGMRGIRFHFAALEIRRGTLKGQPRKKLQPWAGSVSRPFF